MRRHQAARKLRRGQMKNFKYLMQSLVQQVGRAGGLVLMRCYRVTVWMLGRRSLHASRSYVAQ